MRNYTVRALQVFLRTTSLSASDTGVNAISSQQLLHVVFPVTGGQNQRSVKDHCLPGFAETELSHLYLPFLLFVKKEKSETVTKGLWYL